MAIKNTYDKDAVIKATADALENFYTALIKQINNLNILKVMKRKNPYLYRAKSMQSATEIVESVLNATIASSEETIFGICFFEPIAIAASGGVKSEGEGFDIRIDIDNGESTTAYLIAVKSGINAFNADSRKRQEENFATAFKRLRQSNVNPVPIIGYGYGKKKSGGPARQIYQELAGKKFWAELTGDDDFYKKIIDFMGTSPERYVAKYKNSYTRALNRLVKEFTNRFCADDGSILWEKIVEFNSGD